MQFSNCPFYKSPTDWQISHSGAVRKTNESESIDYRIIIGDFSLQSLHFFAISLTFSSIYIAKCICKGQFEKHKLTQRENKFNLQYTCELFLKYRYPVQCASTEDHGPVRFILFHFIICLPCSQISAVVSLLCCKYMKMI